MEHPEHHLVIPEEQTGRRLDQALAALLPDYSRSRLKQWIVDGRVLVDGAVIEPRARVAAGQQVHVLAVATPVAGTRPQSMVLDVAYEDAAVLVIRKPAGLVVHPGAGHREGTLANGLLAHAPALAQLPRSGLIHRLDKETSGLLLVAKTLPAHTRLVRDLQARRIMREYRAVCVGRLTAGGRIEAAIGRHPAQRTRMAVVARGRPAVTHYRVLERFAAHSFIAVRLETGRTHQIRVHMAYIRHPLLGDPAYGGRLALPPGASPVLTEALRAFRRQALHANRLRFVHPVTGEHLDLAAPLPDDFRNLLAALAGDAAAPERLETLTWPETTS